MNADHSRLDDLSYMRFTSPQQIDKAFNTLEGILKGIALDGKIEAPETKELSEWCQDHRAFWNRHPFTEVIPRIKAALSDGILTAEEMQDLLWTCANITRANPRLRSVTEDLQRLQGIIHGIAADGKIEKEELVLLQDWISENEQLCGCYPYDELNALLTSVLKDGVIDQQEHEHLVQFFHSFASFSTQKQMEKAIDPGPSKKELTIPGVCALCPTIVFPEHFFCMTGLSARGRKSDLANAVTELNGQYVDGVPSFLNYLVVGAMGNPAWAFCCYGRKIEAAIKLRKEGKRLLIVHENDFWDSVEDLRAGVI